MLAVQAKDVISALVYHDVYRQWFKWTARYLAAFGKETCRFGESMKIT